jgi:hypothetical protein
VREWERKERGSLPSYVETCIIVWQEGRSPFKGTVIRDFSTYVSSSFPFEIPIHAFYGYYQYKIHVLPHFFKKFYEGF